jgi:glycine hydroxymethyltransferase
MREPEMREIAALIARAVGSGPGGAAGTEVGDRATALAAAFPAYPRSPAHPR